MCDADARPGGEDQGTFTRSPGVQKCFQSCVCVSARAQGLGDVLVCVCVCLCVCVCIYI